MTATTTWMKTLLILLTTIFVFKANTDVDDAIDELKSMVDLLTILSKDSGTKKRRHHKKNNNFRTTCTFWRMSKCNRSKSN